MLMEYTNQYEQAEFNDSLLGEDYEEDDGV